MLLLSRRYNQRVIITMGDGRRITVTVCLIRPEKVRLGFEAPSDIAVHREEVQERIDREREEARGNGD